jgi:hypothetical protein
LVALLETCLGGKDNDQARAGIIAARAACLAMGSEAHDKYIETERGTRP